jgi:prolyl-tRNA synthetase
LDAVQDGLFERALKQQMDMTTTVETYEEFQSVLDSKGGFVRMHWDGTHETELKIKEETKATIRCIPLEGYDEMGTDPISGKPSKGYVYFARSY